MMTMPPDLVPITITVNNSDRPMLCLSASQQVGLLAVVPIKFFNSLELES